ncbi:MAG: hypothetical protein ABJB70_00545, partial [Candidatus Udaeobacter sp.]
MGIISSVYVAYETKRLDRELELIRHFLVHPETKEARAAFVETETKKEQEGYEYRTEEIPHQAKRPSLSCQCKKRKSD